MGRRLTPEDASERIREKLELAGNPAGWTVERVMAGKVVGFAVALVVSLVLALLHGPRLPAHAGLRGPRPRWPATWRRTCTSTRQAYDRADKLQRALPDAIDLLTISVESGLGFDAACAQVARNTDGPLSEEFARMLQEMQIGRGRSEALRSMADRTNLPDLRSFVSAMVQADAFGIPVGQVLRVQSSEIRVKRRQWAEESGPEGAGQDPGPADLLHPALPVHRGARSGGYHDHGQLLGQTLSVTDVGRVALAARVFTVAALTSLAAVAGPRYLDGALLVVLTAAIAAGGGR